MKRGQQILYGADGIFTTHRARPRPQGNTAEVVGLGQESLLISCQAKPT